MVPTEELWTLAATEDLRIVWERLGLVRGLYLATDRVRAIVLDIDTVSRSETALRTVLAHELGHHFATAVDSLTGVIHGRAEARADRWAARFLLPADMLRDQLREGVDIAEENLVEPWLVDVAVRLYWPQRAA